jgi:hypothetical protein
MPGSFVLIPEDLYVARNESAKRLSIQVIVVVVADENQVDDTTALP